MFGFLESEQQNKRILLLLAVMLVVSAVVALYVPPAQAEGDGQWVTLVTGASGSSTTTADAYGYYTKVKGYGEVFVICDPGTGKETGYAYVPGQKVGEKTSQIIDGYTPGGLAEDWTRAKRIDPVRIKIVAPNIPGNIDYTDYSWEHAENTGEYIKSTSQSIQWPGSTQGFLLPGTDPNYWLMVMVVTNPNPWPVKALPYGYVEEFREGSSNYDETFSPSFHKEVLLGANETKYILINKGKPWSKALFMADSEWDDGNPDKEESWSEGYYRSDITENLDPEYPEDLKPNHGFSYITYYVGGGYRENDLSNDRLIASYSVDCRDAENPRRPAWEFEGSVSRTENGWEVSPSSKGTNENTPAATKALVNFFTKHWPTNLPGSGNLDDDDDSITVDKIRFDECKIGHINVEEGPTSVWYDLAGPAIADPASYTLELNSGYEKIFSTNEDYGIIGWINSIPCLRYDPVFLELYEFVPTEAKIGALVKSVVPGYCVRASSLSRPKVTIESTVNSYNVEHTNGVYNTYYNLHVKLQASNPEDARVVFKNINGITHPYMAAAAGSMLNYLYDKYEEADDDENDIVCLYPGFEISIRDSSENREGELNEFVSRLIIYPTSSITLNANQTRILFEGDISFRISFNDSFEYTYEKRHGRGKKEITETIDISASSINSAAAIARDMLNCSAEEAFFVTSGNNPVFSIDTSGTDILSLNQAEGKYSYKNKHGEKRYDFETFGAETSNIYLQPLSYFNSSFSNTEGVCTRPTDEIWKNLSRVKSMSGVGRSGYTDFGDFWPTRYLASEGERWSTRYYWRDSLYYEDD